MDITGPILEETHYYPDGLTMAGISTVAPLKIANNYKFNGIELNNKEFSDGSGLELYSATFRDYDPQIGRWLQIDPNVGSFPRMSPYLGMYGNPVLYSDPNGDCPICFVIAAVVGASINAATHWDQITAGGQFHWDKFGEAVGIGAVAGIVGVATGGAGFAAAGGAAAGVGGFLAGAAGGAIGSAYATGIQSMGNAVAFGDPLPSPGQFLEGIAFGALTGGAFNGVSALANGRSFWNGSLPEVSYSVSNLGGQVGIQNSQTDDIKVPQRAIGSPRGYNSNAVKSIDYQKVYGKLLNHGFSSKHVSEGLFRISSGSPLGTANVAVKTIEQNLPLLRNGANEIIVNGGQFTIRAFVRNGVVINANIFTGTSNRTIGNLIFFNIH